MKRKLITLDEETSNLLAKSPNASEMVRQALRVYKEDISTDTIAGMREAFRRLSEQNKELQSSVDYLIEQLDNLPERLRSMQ